MALAKCKECGNEVSTAAKNCPKCGAPIGQPWYFSGAFLTLSFLLFWPLGLVLIWLSPSRAFTKVLATVFACLVGLLLFVTCGEAMKSTANARAAAATPFAPAQAAPAAAPAATVDRAVPVELSGLLNDYKGNEVRADSLYKGRRIQTSGVVGEIKNDIMNHPYVTVGHGQEFEIPVLQCSLDDDQVGMATTLKKGQHITIRGTVSGLMMNVLASDCLIMTQ